MGKALVIKNVDFSGVALGKVTIEDEVPCTGIELSASGQSVDKIGDTITVTATLTPSNTTDAVTWQTSDNRIATVENGVVIVIGIGSATITATCGDSTATIGINQGAIKFDKISLHNACYPAYYSGEDMSGCVHSNSQQSILGAQYSANDTNYHIINNTDQIGVNQIIPIPFGAIKAAAHTSNSSRIWASVIKYDLVNRTEHAGEQYPTYLSNDDTYITDENVCEYGQAIAYRANLDRMDLVDYIVFS